ncbi:Ankyrin repeat domain-containing protein 27 [Gryllus bimaculatus]|nr:Ankyrin repeat domain-containing protein 27 [Gryllus bimaculatus]
MGRPSCTARAFYGDAERVRAAAGGGRRPRRAGRRRRHPAARRRAARLPALRALPHLHASPRDGYDQDYEEDEDEERRTGRGRGRRGARAPAAARRLLGGGEGAAGRRGRPLRRQQGRGDWWKCVRRAAQVTPLHLAALWDRAAEMQALLAAGADASAADADGRTPLHLAAEGDAHRAVRLLLAAGADPAARDLAGRTALDLSEDAPLRQMLAPKRPWAGIAAIALPISILALYTFLIL